MLYQDLKYKTLPGTICSLAAFSNYLNYLGYHIQEEELFFLSGGLNTTIKKAPNFFNSELNFQHDIPFLCSLFQITLLTHSYSKQEILEKVKNSELISVFIKFSRLPYHRGFSSFNASFCHAVNIIGVSQNENEVYLSDSYLPAPRPQTFEGWCSTDILEDSSLCFVYQPTSTPSSQPSLRNLLFRSLSNNLGEFLLGRDGNGLSLLKTTQEQLENHYINQSINLSEFQNFYTLFSMAPIVKGLSLLKKLVMNYQIIEDIDQIDRMLSTQSVILALMQKTLLQKSLDNIPLLISKFQELYLMEQDIFSQIITALAKQH